MCFSWSLFLFRNLIFSATKPQKLQNIRIYESFLPQYHTDPKHRARIHVEQGDSFSIAALRFPMFVCLNQIKFSSFFVVFFRIICGIIGVILYQFWWKKQGFGGSGKSRHRGIMEFDNFQSNGFQIVVIFHFQHQENSQNHQKKV